MFSTFSTNPDHDGLHIKSNIILIISFTDITDISFIEHCVRRLWPMRQRSSRCSSPRSEWARGCTMCSTTLGRHGASLRHPSWPPANIHWPPTRCKNAVMQLAEAVQEREAYAEEVRMRGLLLAVCMRHIHAKARRAGAIPILTRLMANAGAFFA